MEIREFKMSEDGRTILVLPDGIDPLEVTNITIPDSVTEIGGYAFEYCTNLTNVTIPDSVTEIEGYTFEGCENLTNITIPDSVTEIGSHAFEYCGNLTNVAIPNSVTRIGYCAFKDCTNLTNVTIPDSVTEIGAYAFEECKNLTSVKYKGTQISNFAKKIQAMESCEASHGIPYKTKLDLLAATESHGVLSQNAYNYICKAAHCDDFDLENIESLLNEYNVCGSLPLNKEFSTATYESLKTSFQKNHNGMYPKILEAYAIVAENCNIPPQKLAQNFSLKNIKRLLAGNCTQVGAVLADNLIDNSEIGLYAVSPHKDNINKLLLKQATSKEKHQEKFKNAVSWILHHKSSSAETIDTVTTYAKDLNIKANTPVNEIQNQANISATVKELRKVEDYYEEWGFSFDKCKYDIKFTYSETQKHKAYIMQPDDKNMVMLGYYTHCCQHYDGAGADAMIHGLVNPNAGFWVVENNKGQIIAQAEIWENKDGELVFDNIEFADDRDIDDIKPILSEWLSESPYETVIMGLGYNEMNVYGFEQAPSQLPWVTPEELYIIGEGDFDSVEEAKQELHSFEYGEEYGYTDADEECVYLKKDGIVAEQLQGNVSLSQEDKDRVWQNKAKYYIDLSSKGYQITTNNANQAFGELSTEPAQIAITAELLKKQLSLANKELSSVLGKNSQVQQNIQAHKKQANEINQSRKLSDPTL